MSKAACVRDRTPPVACPVDGKPVSLVNGAEVYSEIDLDLPGYLLDFRRFYNSGISSRSLNAFGVLGEGMDRWGGSFDWRLHVVVRVENNITYRRALVEQPDSYVRRFEEVAGVFKPEVTESETLTALPAGKFAYRSAQNTTYTFLASGQLESIVSANGETATILRQSDGRVISVTSNAGRSITFTLDSLGRISRATSSSGEYADYVYDGYLNLTEVSQSTTGVRKYEYGNASQRARSLLTSVKDELNQEIASIEYNSLDRAIKTHTGAQTNLTTMSYDLGPEGQHNSATTVSPLGQSTTVNFTDINGVRRISNTTQPCTSCGTGQTQAVTYDSVGNILTKTDFRSTVTWYQHNAQNLESIRIEASGKFDGSANRSDERKIESVWANNWRVRTDTKLYRCNPQTGPNTFAACVANANSPTVAELASSRWVLEERRTQAVNARGQVTAQCIHDVANSSAMSYVCGSATNAPAGVRQTRTSFCEAADVAAAASAAAGASGLCPILGLMKATDGPRTDVSDITSYSYYGPNDEAPACASQGGAPACPYRRGDLKLLANALNQNTEFLSYDGAGRLLRSRDANGVLTDSTYHGRGWLLSRTVRAQASGAADPADSTTTVEYDVRGLVQRITQADGSFTRYVYDVAQRLVRVCDNSSNSDCTTGNRMVYTLDAAGNRTKEETFDTSGVLRRALNRQFNSLGRLTREREAADQDNDGVKDALASHVYDGNGNRTQTRDGVQQPTPNSNPNINDDATWTGRDTDLVFDPLNRLLETLDAAGLNSSPSGRGKTRYEYDARDNLRKVIDAQGVPTEYVYNALGDQTQLISRDTGTTNFTYDSGGNKASSTDARGVQSIYSNDALDRLLGVSYPSEPSKNTTFTYDTTPTVCGPSESFHVGRLTGFTDSSGSTQFCYDRRGNTTRKVQITRGVTLTTTMSYNAADRLIGMSYPDGLTLTYSRNALGQVTSISASGAGLSGAQTVIQNASYDADGALLSFNFGNGQSYVRSIDQNGRTSGINSPSLKLFFNFDRIGNITSANATSATAPDLQKYQYDPLYRLEEVRDQNNALIEAFSYDKIGNRKTRQQGSNTDAYSYGYENAGGNEGHWLESKAGSARTYDAMGNMQTGFDVLGLSASYDARGRMSANNAPRLGSMQMDYNAVGERTYRETLSTVRRFVYGDDARLLHEVDEDNSGGFGGGITTSHIWLDLLPVAMVRGGSIFFIQADHLGSPRAVTDQSGSTRWSWNFFATNAGSNAFGSQPPTGDITLNLRFPGQYFDSETALHYNYFRDYEPGTGRYVESDPIGLRGGVSTYGYVRGNPTGLSDATGLNPGAGAIGGFAVGGPPGAVVGAAIGIGLAWLGISAWDAYHENAVYSENPASQGPDKAAFSAERKAYKQRCLQPPPPGLSGCDLLRWLLSRNSDCRRMRKDFGDKWYGDGESNHAGEIANLSRAIENLEQEIALKCCGQ